MPIINRGGDEYTQNYDQTDLQETGLKDAE
jgi:hypothetical protein